MKQHLQPVSQKVAMQKSQKSSKHPQSPTVADAVAELNHLRGQYNILIAKVAGLSTHLGVVENSEVTFDFEVFSTRFKDWLFERHSLHNLDSGLDVRTMQEGFELNLAELRGKKVLFSDRILTDQILIYEASTFFVGSLFRKTIERAIEVKEQKKELKDLDPAYWDLLGLSMMDFTLMNSGLRSKVSHIQAEFNDVSRAIAQFKTKLNSGFYESMGFKFDCTALTGLFEYLDL